MTETILFSCSAHDLMTIWASRKSFEKVESLSAPGKRRTAKYLFSCWFEEQTFSTEKKVNRYKKGLFFTWLCCACYKNCFISVRVQEPSPNSSEKNFRTHLKRCPPAFLPFLYNHLLNVIFLSDPLNFKNPSLFSSCALDYIQNCTHFQYPSSIITVYYFCLASLFSRGLYSPLRTKIVTVDKCKPLEPFVGSLDFTMARSVPCFWPIVPQAQTRLLTLVLQPKVSLFYEMPLSSAQRTRR